MKRITILVALCALVLYGCPSDKVALSVKLYKPCNQTDPLSADYLSVTVTGQDIQTPLYQEYNFSDGTASVPDIPLSKEVRMTVQAFSGDHIATDTLVARGVSAPFDLTGGTDTMDVSILLPRVNAFAQTTDLTPEAVTAAASGNLACSYLAPDSQNHTARQNHAATLLPDGKVLLSGGASGSAPFYSDGLMLYDPATGVFTDTGQKLSFARAYHTATLVNYGTADAPQYKVLIAGGLGQISNITQSLANAEVYDVATQLIENEIPQTIGRAAHTATLMGNGDVVLIGGDSKVPDPNAPAGTTSTVDNYLNTAEYFDIASKTFKTVASTMSVPRARHTATYLVITQTADTAAPVNEKILVIGGHGDKNIWKTAELYTHAEGGRGFTKMTNPDGSDALMAEKRYGHGAASVIVSSLPPDQNDPPLVRNDNIKVVVAGGYQCIGVDRPLVTGCAGSADCCGTGGFATQAASITYDVEVFDPYVGSFVDAQKKKLKTARADFTISELPDRKLLVAGGEGTTAKGVSKAEILSFSDKGILADPAVAGNELATGRYMHVATLLDSGMVLITGGFDGTQTLDSAEIFNPAFPVEMPTQVE